MRQQSIERLVLGGGNCQSPSGKKTRVRNLYARLVRSHRKTPVILAEERDRRVTMVMGPSGVQRLLGKNGFDMLIELGHTAEYIEHEVAAGTKFSLVVFRRQKGMRSATWNGVLAAVCEHYPEVKHLVDAAAAELKRTAFEDWQKQAGFKFAEVHAEGRKDPRFMTVARLLESKGDALAVRRFLYHTVRLTELFSGDGFTRRHDGKRGVREYVLENKVLASLGERVIVELDVHVPE